MLGVYVTVPIACIRKGMAREYLETEPLPPPATCYGFLLSLVGETDRCRHIGARVAPVLLNQPKQSVVLRTVWRVKKTPLGSSGNTRPDYQQLLSPVEWSSGWTHRIRSPEVNGWKLESSARSIPYAEATSTVSAACLSARAPTWWMKFRCSRERRGLFRPRAAFFFGASEAGCRCRCGSIMSGPPAPGTSPAICSHFH